MTKQEWLEMWKLSGVEGDHAWQAKQEMHAREQHSTAITVDIPAYQSMVTGEMIEGRKAHREHLKRHALIEIGNENVTPVSQPQRYDDSIKRRLHEVINSNY